LEKRTGEILGLGALEALEALAMREFCRTL
jgi:hypothetical protein